MAHTKTVAKFKADLDNLTRLLGEAQRQLTTAASTLNQSRATPSQASLSPHINLDFTQAMGMVASLLAVADLAPVNGGYGISEGLEWRWLLSKKDSIGVKDITITHATNTLVIENVDTLGTGEFLQLDSEELIHAGDILLLTGTKNAANSGLFPVASISYSSPNTSVVLDTTYTPGTPYTNFVAPEFPTSVGLPLLTTLVDEAGAADIIISSIYRVAR